VLTKKGENLRQQRKKAVSDLKRAGRYEREAEREVGRPGRLKGAIQLSRKRREAESISSSVVIRTPAPF